MSVICQNITQDDFNYAIECLEDCKQNSAKQFGFNYPYFAPGGRYGEQWWQLDSSLALCGYKWIDRAFAETSILNFIESQKEDGRICLWGNDILPSRVAGGDFPHQSEGVSSLPKIFDVTYHLLQGTSDIELKESAYSMLKKYIDWWFEDRLDKPTGLITAVFEETFIPYLGYAGEYAAVDTNVEVYVGCHYTQLLAEELGKIDDATVLKERKENLKVSINKYLWDDEKGAYYPYSIIEKKNVDLLMASTFFPLRLGIAPKEQKEKLIKLLKDHEKFNWNTIPLTSVSKLDKQFVTTEGPYIGNKSWSGNVWTLINEMVVRGLIDSGEDELAIELALKTLNAFKSNCSEFVNPFDGKGHGVEKYAWTASQFLELVIEVIFGVSYNATENEVVIAPRIVGSLKNEKLSLENLKINSKQSIDIYIEKGSISYNISDESIKVTVIE